MRWARLFYVKESYELEATDGKYVYNKTKSL